MLGEQLWLVRARLFKLLFKKRDDARIELLALPPQQAAIRRVSHERVFKQERRLRRRASAKHKPGLAQPSECGLKVRIALLCDRRQEFIGKLAPDSRTDLRNLLRNGTETVKARHQRSV